MKRILTMVVWSLLGIGVVVAMTFAGRAHMNRLCKKVNVQIDRRGSELFIDENDINKLLEDHNAAPVGRPISLIDIPSMEKLVLTHPAVQSCDAYIDIDGTVNIHLLQRRPVARMINFTGESFYFDDRGYVMPVTSEYTAPLLLVSGYFSETYASSYDQNFDAIIPDSVPNSKSKLDDIWQVVKKIEADSFLRAQIVQVYLTNDKGIELIPRIGDQIIVVGRAEDLDEKFKKLLVFYREGIARTGKWNDYKMINLEFKNQIVCTKK